jgi:hypothetical protein
VGGVHGDGMRRITGEAGHDSDYGIYSLDFATGAFYTIPRTYHTPLGGKSVSKSLGIDTSRVVPTANKVQPRAYGALACVYLGLPQS